ncbi:eukaryotic elongation factor 2 kinase-like isoform X2 [Mya arenaria]|uniref:eukaryotic elongation factor 2 kinase-like isoform X2 n=1 Tax=Mya arenaria TaxID=6604 RepID=UPI0022E40EDA|nr:eukaryotic elongation factor 2 kinase-like isoform X2 [Mya arenaria]XP_052779030.1 eukaryotic elongation factor 2 kinase-like isoform X2 [Mya arenaria]
MSSLESEDCDFDGNIALFPMTDCGSFEESELDTHSSISENESNRDASDENESDEEDKGRDDRSKAFLTLRQRRLSRALATFENLKVNINRAQRNWLNAIRKARHMDDPWEKFHLDEYPVEVCFRHRYNALRKAWLTDEVKVKMEKKPFNRGAMRECFRLKKLSSYVGAESWNHTHNFVAKRYMEAVERDVYFQDVKLQMDAKLWGEEYSRHNPPKKVDIFQMYILEFKNRPDSPLYHCEHLIEGNYIKYNSNSGFVDAKLRNTPQAFSHFTFERSGHQMIVVDIQGVGDLYTDPQLHTIDGKDYGDGNLGAKGMALFFYSHVCNDICHSLGLTQFDISENETKMQNDNEKMAAMVAACTMARGNEELCQTPSPGESIDITLVLKRQRSTSQSDSGFDGMLTPLDEEPMSLETGSPIRSPAYQRMRVRYCSESESSITSTQEEDIRNFQLQIQQRHRPSCVALEKDLRKANFTSKFNDSALGKIHHEMAKYHEVGRFCDKKDADIDWDSALFHEIHAAELGELEAILTMAKLYLGMERDVLINCVVAEDEDNVELGFDYMVQAADAGDRGAMIYVAKAFATGLNLGKRREMSWEDAIHWYDEALTSMNDNDEGGEYDSTMYDPPFTIMANMAEMYLAGGHGLEKSPERAAEMYNQAAESAMEGMKGRLASKYYALAEEAGALCEAEEE